MNKTVKLLLAFFVIMFFNTSPCQASYAESDDEFYNHSLDTDGDGEADLWFTTDEEGNGVSYMYWDDEDGAVYVKLEDSHYDFDDFGYDNSWYHESEEDGESEEENEIINNDYEENSQETNMDSHQDEIDWHRENGRKAFNKMKSDIEHKNYTVWKATKKNNETIYDYVTNVFLTESAIDYALQRLTAIGKNALYSAFSQSLSHANIGVSFGQTAIILYEKGFQNISVGEIMNILGGLASGVGVYVGYAHPLTGLFINGAGITICLIATLLNENEIIIPTDNGEVIYLKRIV